MHFRISHADCIVRLTWQSLTFRQRKALFFIITLPPCLWPIEYEEPEEILKLWGIFSIMAIKVVDIAYTTVQFALTFEISTLMCKN